MDLSSLSEEMPSDIEQLTEAIKEGHREALRHTGRVIVSAARVGKLMLAAKVALPKEKAFTEWLAETFEFSQRTAYNYMAVSEAAARYSAEIQHCESIRDVLKLLESGDPAKKKDKDEKRETFIALLAKLERLQIEETEKSPIEDWAPERREMLKKAYDSVARFHAAL